MQKLKTFFGSALLIMTCVISACLGGTMLQVRSTVDPSLEKFCGDITFGSTQYIKTGYATLERLNANCTYNLSGLTSITGLTQTNGFLSTSTTLDDYALRVGANPTSTTTTDYTGSVTFYFSSKIIIAEAKVYAFKYSASSNYEEAQIAVTTATSTTASYVDVVMESMPLEDLSKQNEADLSEGVSPLVFALNEEEATSSFTIASTQRVNIAKIVFTLYGTPVDDPAADLQIHFLDTGVNANGDCIYIKAGNYDILVDGGPNSAASSVIYPRLRTLLGDNTIDLAIVTHNHDDHIAMFATSSNSIFEAFSVKNLIDFAQGGTSNEQYFTNRDSAVANGMTHFNALQCYQADSTGEIGSAHRYYTLGDNLYLEILYTKYYDTDYDSGQNNNSVCFQIVQGYNRYLFMGDAETSAENSLIESNTSVQDVVLYKANHHGSATSSGSDFMARIKPQYIVSPCVVGSYEYTTTGDNTMPYQSVIDTWANYTYKIYAPRVASYDATTGWGSESLNGEIIVYSDGVSNEDVQVSCSNISAELPLTDWFNADRIEKNGTVSTGTPNRTWPSTGVTLPTI